MWMRKDYMSNRCTHREYYGRFVTRYMREQIGEALGEKLKASQDEHYNDIPLRVWDIHALRYASTLAERARKAGDWCSPAFLVCVLKEAARQYMEQCS